MLPTNLIGQTSNQKLNEIYNFLKSNFKDEGNILGLERFRKSYLFVSLIQKKKN